MAVGDDAVAAGYPLVPGTGEEGKVKYGAREINRTRDFIGLVKALIPTTKAAYRTAGGFTSGSTVPANTVGTDGDVFFKTP